MGMLGWVLLACGWSALTAVILFAAAGRLDLPFVWAYVILMELMAVASTLAAGLDLLRERWKPGPGGKQDLILYASVPLWLAHLVLSGLDIGRFHWSDTLPAWLRVLGLLGLVASAALVTWALSTNKFFSSVIRLQPDRGQRVVSEGPYRFMRHPGYAGALLFIPSSILALGSLVGGIPLLLWIAPLFNRLLTEDRFLKDKLGGYRDYASKVRYRLIPGVW